MTDLVVARRAVVRGVACALGVAALLAGGPAPARAQAGAQGDAQGSGQEGWHPFSQGALKGAAFTREGEDTLLIGCGPETGAFVQVAPPASARLSPGAGISVTLGIDGRRLTYRGKVVQAQDGSAPAVLAAVKAAGPLAAALGEARALRIGAGRWTLAVPLDGGRAALAHFAASCAQPAAAAPETAAAEAPRVAAAPAPQAETAAPGAAGPGAAAPDGPGGRAAPAPLPSAAAIADAIFVDKAEGRRVASKLRITPVDLNEDGGSEAIVTLSDPGWCQDNGCTYFVIAFSGAPRVLGQFIGLGLTPAKTRTDGWRDLTLRGTGGNERMYYRDGAYH